MRWLVLRKLFIKYSWILGLGLILAVTIYLSFNNLFAFQFVDEEDNLILGHFLLQNQKLYSDLFSHHQPIAYIISAFVQFIFKPVDSYQLVQFHRVFMIIWSISWILGLVWFFRWKVIVPIFIFEIIKYYVLGNLFLSEALVVYPIVYLMLSFFKELSKWQYVIIGFLLSLTALLLAPIWPFLAGYLLILYWYKRPVFKQILYFFVGFVLPFLLVLPFIDIYYYFRNVFYINFKYYIPQSAEEKMPLALLKAFFSPIIAVNGPWELGKLGVILKTLVPIFFISTVYLIFKKKYLYLVVVIGLLTLANIRYYSPYLEYKAGFHSLVWLGLFIFFSCFFYQEFILSIKSIFIKQILGGIITLVIIFIAVNSSVFFQPRDLNQDFEKNYSQKMIYGDAIKAMRFPGDTLFVIPDEWLLYFQGDVKNHNKMVNYYGWMSLVWELNDPVIAKFKSNPATFFYCDCSEETVFLYSDRYHQLMRNGAKTPMWILKNKFTSLDETQKQKIRALNFQLE